MNTKEIFINKSNDKHNYFYNYDKSIYVNNYTKLVITCPIHGDFIQKPITHYIQGCGCPECGKDKISKKKYYDLEKFIDISNKKHNFFYDYSESEYIDCRTEIKIICPNHGIFYQKPYVHMNGHGCPICANIENGYNQRKTVKEFVDKSNIIHDLKYDYSNVNYTNIHTKVVIKCPVHGDFYQTPSSHLHGHGCPHCNESKGELKISKLLKSQNIKFIRQKKFQKCRFKLPLYFDFYIPKYNLCIEYDGESHYGLDMHFKYDKELVKKRDNIKNIYCSQNNIELIRISYKDDILEKLKKYIKI